MNFQPRQSFLPYRSLLARGGAGRPFDLRVTPAQVSPRRGEYVLYWSQSARRVVANLALDYAISVGNARRLPVVIYESIRTDYAAANDRIHSFVLEGVAANRLDAERRGIRYHFFLPRSRSEARGALRRLAARAALVVTDDYPAFVIREQTDRFASCNPDIPLQRVDGNGLVPIRALDKEQYSAKFFRDKAHRLLPEIWSPPPEITPDVDPFQGEIPLPVYDGADPRAAAASCEIDHSVRPVERVGGRDAGLAQLGGFVSDHLDGYAAKRNRHHDATSGLSPYLHFGHIGIDEVAQHVLGSDAPKIDIDAFLEEAIIRRELSFNFCHFNRDYASLEALPDWARKTLAAHARDRRMPLYSVDELEAGETDDDVWNLAQRQLLEQGVIHGYLRMLWGKRIIEWSETPDKALQVMLSLHDKYAIDGRDPNTYAGVLWCFGKHDRPWAPERPIFGMIRYMSSEATRKKVDLKALERTLR